MSSEGDWASSMKKSHEGLITKILGKKIKWAMGTN